MKTFEEWLEDEERNGNHWQLLPLDLTIAEYMLIAMKIAWEAGVYEASFEEWI